MRKKSRTVTIFLVLMLLLPILQNVRYESRTLFKMLELLV